jgi:DNA-binding MarR family transcriptional regulator
LGVKRLQDLLFELSSGERMTIMYELKRQESKLSSLSRKLNLTTPEASRNLRRLRGGIDT